MNGIKLWCAFLQSGNPATTPHSVIRLHNNPMPPSPRPRARIHVRAYSESSPASPLSGSRWRSRAAAAALSCGRQLGRTGFTLVPDRTDDPLPLAGAMRWSYPCRTGFTLVPERTDDPLSSPGRCGVSLESELPMAHSIKSSNGRTPTPRRGDAV